MILHVLIVLFAGWMQRHQQQTIAYLLEENRILKARLGGRRAARVLHQQPAQRLAHTADEVQIGTGQLGVRRQQLVVDEPRMGVGMVGEAVRTLRQLDRIDQRLNKHQRPGSGFRLIITGPLHRSRAHPLSLPAHDRYINLTGHA